MSADVEGGHRRGEVSPGGGAGRRSARAARRVVGGLDVLVGQLAATADVVRDNLGDGGPFENRKCDFKYSYSAERRKS